MNKYLIIFTIIAGFQMVASSNFSANLSSTNNLGFKNNKTIIRENNQITLNGYNMASEKVILVKSDIIKLLKETPKDNGVKVCSAGRYTYQVRVNKNLKKESGCIESKRYAYLIKLFKVLE